MMRTRPQFKNGLAIIVGFVLSALPVCAASLLTNPGFEADPQGQTTALLGWNTYSGGSGNVFSETSASLAHSGTNYLKVYQAFTGSVNYNGVTQDNLSGPGAVYSADGWAYTLSSDALAGQNVAWIEVTFRDAAANVLALYRSELITTNLIAKGVFPKSSLGSSAHYQSIQSQHLRCHKYDQPARRSGRHQFCPLSSHVPGRCRQEQWLDVFR